MLAFESPRISLYRLFVPLILLFLFTFIILALFYKHWFLFRYEKPSVISGRITQIEYESAAGRYVKFKIANDSREWTTAHVCSNKFFDYFPLLVNGMLHGYPIIISDGNSSMSYCQLNNCLDKKVQITYLPVSRIILFIEMDHIGLSPESLIYHYP